jgi:hypothetical protein
MKWVNEMKKIIALSLVVMIVASLTLTVSARSIYSDLNWDYPLDESLTEYYRGYSPTTHYGFDFATSSGDDIYSADRGTVAFSGYHSSTGYYVVVSHTDKLSGVTNPLYVRYLHMDNPPEVDTNDSVYNGDLLGYTGSSGAYIGSNPVPHLHMDVNKIKATGGSQFTSSNTINPALFYPDVDFSSVSYLAASSNCCVTETDLLPQESIDNNLIKFVGIQEFDAWVEQTDTDTTLSNFLVDFGISNMQFNTLINEYNLESVYGDIA